MSRYWCRVASRPADLPNYPALISQQFANPPIVQAMSSLSVCNAEFTAQKARAASLQTAYNAADGTTETIAGTVLGGCFEMAPTTVAAGALLTITQNKRQSIRTLVRAHPAGKHRHGLQHHEGGDPDIVEGPRRIAILVFNPHCWDDAERCVQLTH